MDNYRQRVTVFSVHSGQISGVKSCLNKLRRKLNNMSCTAGALDFNKWTNIVISNSKKVFFLLQIVGIYIIENVLYFQSSEKYKID